jgi:hypothetical protein
LRLREVADFERRMACLGEDDDRTEEGYIMTVVGRIGFREEGGEYCPPPPRG